MRKVISVLTVGIIMVFIVSFVNINSNSFLRNEKFPYVIEINMAKASGGCSECHAGDSCYPRAGFECNLMGTGNDCSMVYNCNKIQT